MVLVPGLDRLADVAKRDEIAQDAGFVVLVLIGVLAGIGEACGPLRIAGVEVPAQMAFGLAIVGVVGTDGVPADPLAGRPLAGGHEKGEQRLAFIDALIDDQRHVASFFEPQRDRSARLL